MRKLITMMLALLSLALTSAQDSIQKPRLVMYYDQWHPNVSLDLIGSHGVTHIILAFMLSHHLNDPTFVEDGETWKLPEPGHQWHVDTLKQIKSRFPDVKVSLAIGGWNDDAATGWREAIASTENLDLFVNNLHHVVNGQFPAFEGASFDGVDIDWEYPGGNGVDKVQLNDAGIQSETQGYLDMLTKIKSTIGDKELSIAVPGKQVDMMAYTRGSGPAIFKVVDYVNIMSYDIMNRRDTKTSHHTSVVDSLATVEMYLANGMPPYKANLGFAFYAKWFTINNGCDQAGGLGCDTPKFESENGTDLYLSGSMTFETKNTMDVPSSFTQPQDGKCGPESGAQCSAGFCCSADGWCGNTAEHCGSGRCYPAYSASGCCEGPDLWASWKEALSSPFNDSKAGGYTYLDQGRDLFWTWDPVIYVNRKLDDIVKTKCLGGAMAWSFGEENQGLPSHISALGQGVQKLDLSQCADVYSTSSQQSEIGSSPTAAQTSSSMVSQLSVSPSAVTTAHPAELPPNSSLRSVDSLHQAPVITKVTTVVVTKEPTTVTIMVTAH